MVFDESGINWWKFFATYELGNSGIESFSNMQDTLADSYYTCGFSFEFSENKYGEKTVQIVRYDSEIYYGFEECGDIAIRHTSGLFSGITIEVSAERLDDYACAYISIDSDGDVMETSYTTSETEMYRDYIFWRVPIELDPNERIEAPVKVAEDFYSIF